MLLRFLILVHVCVAFPFKCPEPAQWSLRARGHCSDPAKYFCLKNDLINGYSENCTVFDFLQPGRKHVLRGGLDADICSSERFQPWPINFFTNVSTNCIFLKSTCNEDGQVIYGKGNRNIDTTCRCDYTRGYNFLFKPRNPCFCVPSQEDCSCFLKACPKSTDILSPDYECLHVENNITVSECKPIIYERVITASNENTTEFISRREHISNNVQKKMTLIAICFGLIILFSMIVLTDELLDRYWRDAFYLYKPLSHKTIIEGDDFELTYKLSTHRFPVRFLRNDQFIPEVKNVTRRIEGRWKILLITGVTMNDAGFYCLEVSNRKSEPVKLSIQRVFTSKIKPQECIEGKTIQLTCSVYADNIEVKWYKEEHELQCQRYLITSSEHDRMLTIKNSTVGDSGMYHVKANNVQMKVQVTVKAIITRPLENVTIMEGLDTILECETEEENCPVQWLTKDNEISNQSDRIKMIGKLHSLTILQTSLEDSGTYTVKTKGRTSHAVLTVKEMPATIKQMPVQERDEFLKAAKSGTTKRYDCRIMIVGENEVGKTSLLRRLMNEQIDGVQSTDGIEKRKCQINIQSGEWQFPIASQVLHPCSSGQSQEFADCCFWDFAGQKEFYATHQTFLCTHSVYLLVVDISRNFKTKTYIDMIEKEFDNVGKYIDFWLDNIHCYSIDERNISSQYQKESDLIHPPVIIVGTGIDKIPEPERKKRTRLFLEHLNKDLHVNEKRRHLRKVFFLSNKFPTDYLQEFKRLRENILSEAMTLNNWGDQIPTRWIVLEKEMYTRKDKHVIKYTEAKELATDCSFPDVAQTTSELDSFLKYEHDIGNIIFFKDVNNFIVLDPEWLANVFKCFVSHQYKESMGIPEWALLAETGILKDNLINKLLQKLPSLISTEHKEFVLKLMEKFDIIVRPKNDDWKHDIYMPCMIKPMPLNAVFGTVDAETEYSKKSSWFCLVFNFLPPSYFNHILVSFVKNKQLIYIKKDKKLGIYRNIGIFELNAIGSERLVICLAKNLIAMQVLQLISSEDVCYSTVKKELITLVDSIKQRYRIHVTYEIRFKCPSGRLYETEGIGCDDAMENSEYGCTYHNTMHSCKEIYRNWMEEEEVEEERKKKGRRKCTYCESMSVYTCYDCNTVLCKDCFRKHTKMNKYHLTQLISDSFILNFKFRVGDDSADGWFIRDIKCLPNGLMILAAVSFNTLFVEKSKVMTFSVSGKQKHVLQLENRQRMMDIVDKNTVAVLLSNNSVAIVDIQQNNVQYLRNIAIPYTSGTFIYIENQFYVDGELGIIVFDMSGTLNRRIELSFTPRNMCYDVKSQRIYCYNDVNSKLVCIDRDGTIAFTFADPNWTNLNRITIDNDGNLLVLCIKGVGSSGYVIKVDFNDKSSEVVIRNIKMPSYRACICFDRLTNSVVIGVNDTVYIYKKSVNI